MGALGSKLRTLEGGGLMFRCPGCGETHAVRVGEGSGPRWGWNGSGDAPTFTPSILVTWSEPSDVPEEFDDTSKDIKRICHSFVTDGRIQFLSDCTHALSGQTVDLPNWTEGT
ncbi:DUF6527 family protein [Rhodobacter capsulatus]|uniref:DUF6527 family protein n=1 Tax=Rhodobacter capsulatus TaxID=1061 RepID=UPI0040265837